MIIARIDGGLGNQMFQYAYGRYLAARHQTQLYLDTSSYAGGPQHGYLLHHLRIQADEITEAERKRIPQRYLSTGGRLAPWRRWVQALAGGSLRRYKERPFGFRPQHLTAADNSYLVGYWQSEKFFPGLRGVLLDELSLRQPLSAASQAVAQQMQSPHSLALHVRRGDYVTQSAAQQLYVQHSIDYYRQAVESFAASVGTAELFVFSNDIAWCRDNLQMPYTTHYVDHNNCQTAHEDLALMSLAAGCAIANSTFSWWAAWLNQRADKRVYAPSQWFHPGTLDSSSVLCSDWHCIPVQASATPVAA